MTVRNRPAAEPVKILQVVAGLQEGGVERGTLEMSGYILACGAKSYVASSGGRLVEDLEREGAQHFLLPLDRRNPWSIVQNAFALAAIVRRSRIDLIHARSRAPAWAALFASRATKVPFLTTFHGTHKIQNGFKRFYNSSMVRGERVIAISQFIRSHVIENYSVSPESIDVAPRGFSPSEFNLEAISRQEIEQLRSSLGIGESDLVVSLPGRLTPWKGQIEFLASLAQLSDLPGWKALLIGGAGKKLAYEQKLRKLSKEYGLEDRVLFVGSQKNMALYYAASDLVVSASIEPEAFGRVAVEAQAMAKPVIATAHGGSLETVVDGETGWLVPPDDSESMAAVLRKIISGEYCLDKIGLRGREWVVANFTTDKTCRAEWDAYRQVLGI
jgi:glycosyltransferase involved in cell wall biosynthesis